MADAGTQTTGPTGDTKTSGEVKTFGGLRLQVRLSRSGETVKARVLQQAEELRGTGRLAAVGNSPYSLHSSEDPAIYDGHRLYVRGTEREGDDQEASHQYESVEAAIEGFNAFGCLIMEVDAGRTGMSAGATTSEKAPHIFPVTPDEPLTAEHIARVCHEANRAYCLALGDSSQPHWDDAPAWQRDSAVNGVRFHIENPTAGPEGSHDNWWHQKQVAGWEYGPVKDAAKKTHPCMVPYEQLSPQQRAKDRLFVNIVHALKTIV